ncbi:hypothetical protein EST35_0388 [Pseudomonas phage vB_PaeM_PA5oct]|uniref:Uncharacterized protein n=1 Tax=Pseudomonas phage vB_PaeM_PA5oct TaxID=2163605 RepID=A0A4Y5JUB2_9CAUD|nr:hypothetical protein PQE65_gp097 [Pseudomonas phage vB_PaeM_PA5oct]QCG76268.1 hypothetical protein EST35_0388 [Pseudomonas phage vB_PaeM_PA5oct]
MNEQIILCFQACVNKFAYLGNPKIRLFGIGKSVKISARNYNNMDIGSFNSNMKFLLYIDSIQDIGIYDENFIFYISINSDEISFLGSTGTAQVDTELGITIFFTRPKT